MKSLTTARSLSVLLKATISDHHVVLYSKPGCCLCDEVKEQLTRLQERHRFEWSEVNILDDPALFDRYQHEIPLVFIHGREAFKYHLDERAFLKWLRQPDRDLRVPSHQCSADSR